MIDDIKSIPVVPTIRYFQGKVTGFLMPFALEYDGVKFYDEEECVFPESQWEFVDNWPIPRFDAAFNKCAQETGLRLRVLQKVFNYRMEKEAAAAAAAGNTV
jgi:hypothetical protein